MCESINIFWFLEFCLGGSRENPSTPSKESNRRISRSDEDDLGKSGKKNPNTSNMEPNFTIANS